jgi:hypothetical protein
MKQELEFFPNFSTGTCLDKIAIQKRKSRSEVVEVADVFQMSLSSAEKILLHVKDFTC